MKHSDVSPEANESTPDILVNQPAAFGLGLCDAEALLTLEQQASLVTDLEQLAKERILAQTALLFMHS